MCVSTRCEDVRLAGWGGDYLLPIDAPVVGFDADVFNPTDFYTLLEHQVGGFEAGDYALEFFGCDLFDGDRLAPGGLEDGSLLGESASSPR